MSPARINIREHIEAFAGKELFAENKDIAKQLRESAILPALRDGRQVVLDFNEISGATQSFVHALISESIRQFRATALENLLFKNCNAKVREIIRIVFAYMQESLDTPGDEIN